MFRTFYAGALTVSALLLGYLYFRFVHESRLSGGHRALAGCGLAGVIAVLYAAPSLYRGSAGPLRGNWMEGTQWFAYTLMGFMACLILYSVMFDLARAAHLLWERLAGSPLGNPERRWFLVRSGKAAVLGVSVATAGVGLGQAIAGPKLVETDVPIRDLPPGLDGLRIAQLSDLHIGPTIGRDYIARAVELANSGRPDLVAVTGDLADGDPALLASDSEPLASLRAPLGVYYCSGNHDYYSGIEAWTARARALGMIPLENEHRVLELRASKLVVGGVRDYACARFRPDHVSSPADAIRGAPADAFPLLLAHQPKSCFDAARAGWRMQLSGHTHAGQFFPFRLLARWAHPYFEGLDLHDGKMWVYVNRGTGYWGPPNRFANRAEVSLLTLRRT